MIKIFKLNNKIKINNNKYDFIKLIIIAIIIKINNS